MLRTFSSVHNLTTGETVRMDQLPEQERRKVQENLTKRFLSAQGLEVEIRRKPEEEKEPQ